MKTLFAVALVLFFGCAIGCNVDGLERCTDRYLNDISSVTTTNQFCRVYGDWLRCWLDSGCYFGFFDEILQAIEEALGSLGCDLNLPSGPCVRPKLPFGFDVCGEYGDPHLRLFDNSRITCRSEGRSLLYSNEYFDVYWTNVEVDSTTGATSTSKIEFVSRGCTPGTWEWTNEGPFEVKTETHGIYGTRVYIEQRENRADVYQLETGTHIVITQAAGFLNFGMRTFNTGNATGACVIGCPGQEININGRRALPRGDPDPCEEAGLTGYDLEACQFDVSVTSNSEFVISAAVGAEVNNDLENEDAQTYSSQIPAASTSGSGRLLPFSFF